MTVYTLYLKTHNITGLKYLGYTKQNDPYSYEGSGTIWKRHIKKHGYDVTTDILFRSDSLDEIKEKGIYYSNLWQVVSSNEFANLKEERGSGGWDHYNGTEKHLRVISEIGRRTIGKLLADYGHIHGFTKDSERTKEASKKGHARLKQLYPNGTMHGKTHTEESKKIISEKASIRQTGSGNNQYGTMWINNGIRNMKIHKTSDIPEGFRRGRIMSLHK